MMCDYPSYDIPNYVTFLTTDPVFFRFLLFVVAPDWLQSKMKWSQNSGRSQTSEKFPSKNYLFLLILLKSSLSFFSLEQPFRYLPYEKKKMERRNGSIEKGCLCQRRRQRRLPPKTEARPNNILNKKRVTIISFHWHANYPEKRGAHIYTLKIFTYTL
jgi:hypothetical protein